MLKGLTRKCSSGGTYKGHSKKLWKDRVNRDVLKLSFANRVIELPVKFISANCNNSFENMLDKYFF